MSLGTRGSLDPRFAWYGRVPARGAMQAIVSVFSVATAGALPDTSWQPFAADPALRVPTSPHQAIESYRGPARISPNVDWRARKSKEAGEIVTEHAIHIELDFRGNTLPGDFPDIGVGDWLFVKSAQSWGGRPAIVDLDKFTYVVRNIAESSQPWVKALLCDITVNNKSDG